MRRTPARSTRRAHALALALIALIALGACGGPSTPIPAAQTDLTPAGPAGAAATAPPDAATTAAVTIGFAAPEFEREAYTPLIAAFNAQNPDVQVRFVALDEGAAASLDQIMRQTVGAADTAAVFFLRPEDIKNGLVRDLRPLIDADPAFDRDDFYPGALTSAGTNDGIYLAPRTLRLTLLSYNKELWARRGLPSPQAGWTWSDLLAAAEQLAQRRGDTIDVYGLAEGGGGLTALAGLLAEAGIDPATPAEQARLDQPKVAQAVERVAALAKSGALYLSAGSGDQLPPDTFLKLIADQRVAMWFGAPMIIGPDVPKPAFAVGTAALPPASSSAFGGAEGYIMSSGTAHPEAAWRWLSFLSRQEVRRPLLEGGAASMAPARKSLAERSGYWRQLDAEAAAAVRATLERGAPALASSAPDQRVIEALGQALAAVAGGKRPVAQALAEAQAALDRQIAQAQATPSPTPDIAPVVVATPAPAGPAPGATAITFKVPLFQANQLRRLADEFNRQHPELFVQVESVRLGDDMTLARMADGADCFSWPEPAAASQISGTLDLQPLIDADVGTQNSVSLRDDYPAALLAPFRRGTALYGLPYQVRLRALTYNQSAFDAAGLEHPSASWTADDLLNAAKQLTSGGAPSGSGDRRYGYAALGTQTDDLLFFLGLLGARATRDGAPNFTDPEVAQAARFYIDLLRNYSPHKRIQGYTRNLEMGDEAFQLVEEGRVGMWFDLPGGLVIVRIGPGEAGRQSYTRAIAPPPGAANAAPDSFEAGGLYIAAAARQPEACWEWLKFLSGDLSALEGNFPARRSLAESDAFVKGAPAGAAEVYAAYRPALDRTPADVAPAAGTSDAPVDLFWLFRAVDRALQGQDLDRELADAQARTEQFVACARGGGAPLACAKQADPTYAGLAGDR